MSDDYNIKRPVAKYEPGELDNTRKNIGLIDADEARKMAKLLGGEVFAEKTAPIDKNTFPSSRIYHSGTHASGKTSADIATLARDTGKKKEKDSDAGKFKTKHSSKINPDGLPPVSNQVRQQFDHLMMSEDYKIKQDYGLFNFIRLFTKNGTEKISHDFAEYTIKNHVIHLQSFITSIKMLIQISPDTYKGKITTDDDAKFRFLRTAGAWTMRDIKLYAIDIEEHPEMATVVTCIPFIKAVYKQLLTVYYLGESQIPAMIKDIYSDLCMYPKADKEKLAKISKEAITEWLYIYSQVIRGLYPLLMRMCSLSFENFPGFFTVQSSAILSFLGLTKYQIQMPEKNIPKETVSEEKTEEKKQEEPPEEEKEEKNNNSISGSKTEVVRAGIKLLDQLFPEAGFNSLETLPDMYPYFQPLYQFKDGFNMLAPENPLQITVVLLRIMEDLFQGCRNIKFNIETDPSLLNQKDTLSAAMNDWSLYREVLFDRQYCGHLRDFVNQQYTQSDFKTSQFGKKLITNMLWQTKYNFLPNFEFEQLLLERPQNDSQYRPLCLRTDFLRALFTSLSHRIDEAAQATGPVIGIQNPWERYRFDISNVMSKRMDVLLGARRPAGETAATNANLIKYTLCIISVLDWWVNNTESPAYATDTRKIYRISEKDGAPVFSVPVREDQNKLFAARVKEAIEKRTPAANT
jgi:hypothetical protein